MVDIFEKAINDIFKIESIDEILFKSIEISEGKTACFAFRLSQKIMFGELTSCTMDPICFILEMNGEYYYCPLNGNDFDESVVKKFALKKR